MAPRTRTVIFDTNRTLIDSVAAHARAWQETLGRYGYEFPFKRVRQQIGKGGDPLMPGFLPEDVIERDGERIQKERSDLFKSKYLDEILAFPGARELFQRIKAEGIKVVLGSSAKADELKRYEEITRIEDLVEATTSSDEAEKSKPSPDVFQAALAKLQGVAPRGVLVVGDTPHDAEAAGKGRSPHDRRALRRVPRVGPPRHRLLGELPRPGRPPGPFSRPRCSNPMTGPGPPVPTHGGRPRHASPCPGPTAVGGCPGR